MNAEAVHFPSDLFFFHMVTTKCKMYFCSACKVMQSSLTEWHPKVTDAKF